MATKDIEIKKDIRSEREKIADATRQRLREQGVYAFNVIGAPGAGKTSCLLRIVEGLPGISCSVIEGDIQSDIDTEKLRAAGIRAVQINTGGECHLDGIQIKHALDLLPPEEPGLLFIENIGNLVCPAESNIGEEMKLLIVTVAEGADKPYKYPLAFEKAGGILLNKADLIPHVEFDMAYFMRGIRALNPEAPVFEVSAKAGEGFSEVCAWIKALL